MDTSSYGTTTVSNISWSNEHKLHVRYSWDECRNVSRYSCTVSTVVTWLLRKNRMSWNILVRCHYIKFHMIWGQKKNRHGKTQSGRWYNYNFSLQMGQNNRNGITPSSAQHMFQTEECCTCGLQKTHMLRRRQLLWKQPVGLMYSP
jgi:hypothetical protein